jgi:hypothetical protein
MTHNEFEEKIHSLFISSGLSLNHEYLLLIVDLNERKTHFSGQGCPACLVDHILENEEQFQHTEREGNYEVN